MEKFIKEVDYFSLPYLSDDGKFIECITEYNKYNMELVEKDRNKILEFVIKHFSLRASLIRIDELLYDQNYRLWNQLNSVYELEVFERLVGLLIAVGLIEDSYITRTHSFGGMRQYGEFLVKEKFCLDDDETAENYLITLKDYVLPFYRFNVNSGMFEYMTRFFDNNKGNELKEKLLSWIKMSTITINNHDLEIIKGFLNNNLEGFFNAIVVGFDTEDGSTNLVNYLRFDPEFDYLAKVNNMISTYNDSQKEDLENKKRLFLERIEESIKKRKLQ